MARLDDAVVTKGRGPFGRLYHGETNIDFVGRTKVWFALSAGLLLLGLLSLGLRGLNLGIDFEGGAVYEVPTQTLSVEDVRETLGEFGLGGAKVQEAEAGSNRLIRVQTETVAPDEAQRIQEALAAKAGVDTADISRNEVGPSWGREISDKALKALGVFLVVISLYITLRFEFKMAIPTLAALIHDVLMTVGIYSISGLEVTPATVIAVLTILGFSIYDGIVVFDKVDENTRQVSAGNRMTYSDMVNLSLNQTLMRSLNTSITALIPISSLLVIGSFVLGAKTLEEFGVALLIGLASGAYSSLFIASPLLALMKEREPRYRDIRRRMVTRDERLQAQATKVSDRVVEVSDAAEVDEEEELASVTSGEPTRSPTTGAVVPTTSAIPPRPRKKGRRR